ncbi:MAG: hypothetical protein WDZ40_02660 [Candidatus Spechtbacterales bacterium]
MLEALADKGAKIGAEAAEEALKKDEEWRDEMYGHWVHTSIDPKVSSKKREGAKILIERHRQASESTVKGADAKETLMMHSLGKAWHHLNGTKQIRDNFFYLGLGHMEDDAFAAALDALHDDKIQQWIGKIGRVIEGAYGKAEGWAVKLFNRVLDALTGAEDLGTVSDKLAVIFSDAVQASDILGGTALAATNKGLGLIEKMVDKIPGGRK